jgi:hypothetical protein
MVKNGGSVEAHQWSSATQSWTKIGDVVNAVSQSQKQTYEGVEYDYVFDVAVQEGAPALKLPYNVVQNPYEAAQKFLEKNGLDMAYIDQIVKFIEQSTGGVKLGTGGGAVDPYCSSLTIAFVDDSFVTIYSWDVVVGLSTTVSTIFVKFLRSIYCTHSRLTNISKTSPSKIILVIQNRRTRRHHQQNEYLQHGSPTQSRTPSLPYHADRRPSPQKHYLRSQPSRPKSRRKRSNPSSLSSPKSSSPGPLRNASPQSTLSVSP